MSGICGAYGRGDIERMTRVLHHRGPDDMGVYIEGPMQFGVRRLAVIDIPGGHQPVSNEDQTVWALLDGDVFNHRELKTELEGREHEFITGTDTEVIAHAYEQWGPECLRHFNGQFALAVWDGKTIFLARDRMGEKPLYFYQRGGRLLFASEMKAILTEVSAAPRFTDEFRDFEVPLGGDTLFAGIRELPPAHYLTFNGRELKLERWWEVPVHEGTYNSDADCEEELRWLLRDAVELRLRGDVPVGAFLSGGLDSSAIACLAKPEHVFCVSFKKQGDAYDELAMAKLVAAEIGAKIHVITPGPDDLRQKLPGIIWHLDQPVGSLSGLAAFMAAEAAKKRGIKALLAGQGADELFGGNTRYLMMLAEERIGLEPAMRNYLPLARYFWSKDMFQDPADRYYHLINRGPGKDPKCRNRVRELFSRHRHLIDKMGYADLHLNLPTVLHLDDRATAAYGIENRNPFLDYRIVEFAFRLPPHLKVDGFVGKVILRNALRGIVPDQILDRPDKMGLIVPVGPWFKKDLKRWAETRLRRFRALYVANFLNAAWDAAGDRGEFDRKDYMRVCLQIWADTLISPEHPDWDSLRLSAK